MDRISDRLRRHVAKILDRHDIRKVVLGLSGGADSVCLLRMLCSCKCEIHAIHCNFHLRGDESCRDMIFCKNLCRELGVNLDIVDFDVPSHMQRNNIISIEEACRELRYNLFRDRMKLYDANRIAIAHNADDNIETLLLNLLRGAGINGLKGMREDQNDIVRPLLTVSRNDILECLLELEQDFIIDSSNLSNNYRRNFLRNEVIPLLQTKWPGAKKAIGSSITNLQGDAATLEFLSNEQISLLHSKYNDSLPYSEILQWPDPEWLIHRWCATYGTKSNVSREITKTVMSNTATGKKWVTAMGTIYGDYKSITFVSNNNDLQSPEDLRSLFTITEYENTPELRESIKAEDNNVFWTDIQPDKCLLRHPQTGDRISPIGITGSQLVSKTLKDKKIPSYQRKETIVLEYESEILWIAGYRRSRHHLITEESRRIYRWEKQGS